ncbi:rod shape-determining protein MreD [Clostridium sp.]|jgi:rod shape-determining protein MreD|uniref:rod shape-determining protein MreD n=1 Tax=Clostridium sp. TaxID=1506 RepID=UPI0039F558D7
MKRIITVSLLSILFLILDNTLMPFFSIKGAYPSLLFVFAICYSIIAGSWSAVFIGVLSGLLQDVYLTNGLGINMLINMLICLIAAEIGKTIFKDKSLIPIIAGFFLSILKGILMFAILYIVKQYTDGKLILYISIYNMIVTIFMYKKVYKLSNVDFMMKNWKF